MGQAESWGDVPEHLAAAAAAGLGTGLAAVWMLKEADHGLVLAAAYGLPPDWPPGATIPLSHIVAQPTAWAQDAIALAGASPALPPGAAAGLCVPLMAEGQPQGILCVYAPSPHSFTPSEVGRLRALARLGVAAVSAARQLEALTRAELERGRLARVTAHELRSPITVAQSLLRNVLRGYAGPLTPQQRDIFARISGQLDFLSNLVNDFLDLTASRTPASIAGEGPVTLNESLARVVLALQPRAEEKGVSLTLRPPREELAVWATEEGLDHIFTNLVDNAVKYTPEGGAVSVTALRVGDQARVTVADTGIGIPPDALPHLFEEFYRAPNARAMKAVGTGLGLAIVKGLVERYRGQIAVESTVGQGTTFTVTLPLHNAV